MDSAGPQPEFSLKNQSFIEPERAKTSLRMTYEAQSEVIRKQIGDLEQVREKLGLSARKISQLLLVDPSAWTRWTRTYAQGEKDSAPPHIWRALQWYMILQDKIPGLTPQFFIGKDSSVVREEAFERIRQMESQLQIRQKNMEKAIDQQQRLILDENERLIKKVKLLEAAVKANRIGFILMGLSAVILAIAFFRLIR